MALWFLAFLAVGSSAGSVLQGWSQALNPLDNVMSGWICFDYTLDLCTLPSGVIITKVTVEDPTTCQLFCRIYADCQMWTFDEGIQGENCFLINMDPNLYINSCLEFGGPDYPTIDMCIPESMETDCSKFTKGKCTYPSGTLEVLPDVAEPPADGSAGCDDACKLRSDCVYWKYLFEEDECVLYSSRDKSCLLTRGPRYPDLVNCSNVEPPCRDNADCVDPEVCVDGFCQVCTEDSHCEEGYECVLGECVLKGCENDKDCLVPGEHCDVTDGKCYVCVTDDHCPGGVCNTTIHLCFECLLDTDCEDPAEPVCSSSNTCVECENDGQCTHGVCDEPNNTCYECLLDTDCEDPAEPVCSSSNTCVECENDDQCTDGVCDEPNNTCYECLNNSDCTNPAEPLCSSSNNCVECINNNDCTSAALPVCTSMGICVECERTEDCGTAGVCDESTNMCGCREQEDCPGYNAICDANYSNCNYCNATENVEFGSCNAGCKTDDNCAAPLECYVDNQCKDPPSFLSLKQIIFDTLSCEGCQGTNVEDGPILHIIGGEGVGGIPECYTNPLDHKDRIDFAIGTQAIFDHDDENAQEILNGCDRADLLGEVTGGSIEWTSQTGSWSLVGDQVDFGWSNELQCKYSCCLDNPTLSPSLPVANLTQCKKNCGDNLVCV